MDYTEIIYEKSDRVATITLNRPARLNAFNARMGMEIKSAMLDAEHDDTICAIVVTGAGRAFCSGADQKMAAEMGSGFEPRDRSFLRCVKRWSRIHMKGTRCGPIS
jgi:enoyl-CoA hydratase/carnithine racemase